MALGVLQYKIPIYPIFYLHKGTIGILIQRTQRASLEVLAGGILLLHIGVL